jgi:hypothetical protein
MLLGGAIIGHQLLGVAGVPLGMLGAYLLATTLIQFLEAA